MSSVTREEVLQIINEQIYFTQVQNTQFTDLTLSEKIGTLVKSSLGRINTDNNTVWFNEPVKSTLINKGNIYTSEILPFSTTRNYYTIVSVHGKKYISSVTLTNLVTNLCNIPLSSVLTGTNVIPPSSPDTTNTSYSDSRDVIQGDFNTSGFLTRYPRNAWVFFNYWKKQLTGTKSRLTGTTDLSVTANTGTYPNMQNDKSVILTLNSSNDPNPDATYNTVIPNTTIMNDLRDYQTIGLISNTLVTEYFDNLVLPDGVTKQTAQLNEEMYNKIQTELISNAEPLDVVLGVPTISTWNGIAVNTSGPNHTDNISFYNPLLVNSLNELFGYSSQGQGNGYAITAPLSSGNRRNINTTAGVVGTITESPFSFSSLEGFFICKGLKFITEPLGSANISALPISAAVPPVITAVRYTGETLAGSLINQGALLPTSGKVDDLFINTTDRKIYRYTGTEWISVGGNDIFKEVGEERTYTERDIAIGKTTFSPDVSYALDVSGLVNFNNQLVFTTNTDISINSNFNISGDLIVKGNYVIEGTTSSTNTISVQSNTIVINEGIENTIYVEPDSLNPPLNSGIIINRAKEDADTPQDPFKIIYTDDRTDTDEYLSIGIGTDLHRVATIDASKNFHDQEFVLWDGINAVLKPQPSLSISNEELFIQRDVRLDGFIYDMCNNVYISGKVVSDIENLPEIANENQLFINTKDRKIYRYDNEKWTSVGGNDIFKEVGETRTFTDRMIAVGKETFDSDISYALDVSGLVNFNNQIITSTNDVSINSNLDIAGTITTDGDVFNKDTTYSSVFPHQDENTDVGIWGILNKMFDQPPKFKQKGTDAKSTFFEVEWEKAFSSLRFSHDGTEVPHIETIGIDIRHNGVWYEIDQNIPPTTTSYRFLTNGVYGGITISLDEIYDVRIYGINKSKSTTYNYLLFENMAIVPPREPSAPRNVLFDLDVSFNYINVKYTAPVTFNLDIVGGEPYSDEPALEHYKIVYKPEGENGSTEFNTLRNSGNTGLSINEITVLATTNLNYDAANIITKITHTINTPLYPASRYVLKEVSAKNILNETYSANGVTPPIVIVTPPPPIVYGGPIFPFFLDNGNVITEIAQATRITITAGIKRTFNIGSTKIIDASYINLPLPNSTASFTVSASQSGVYVNREIGKLGKNYKETETETQNDTFAELYYNIDGTDVSYQILNFKGFSEGLNIGSVRFGSNHTDLDICFNTDPFASRVITSANGPTIDAIAYRGYGLYGYFELLSQPNSIGHNKRFQPRSNVQKIGYRVKSFTVDTKQELNIYIDDLSGNPLTTDITTALIPKTVRYCYGIPSIGLFDVSVNYTISNYASKFLPPDGKISDICLNPLPFVLGGTIPFSKATENIIRTVIEPSTNINYVFNNITMNIDVDRNTFNSAVFNSAVRIRSYNLNFTTTTAFDVIYPKPIHNDSTSFISAISTNIKAFGQGVYRYDHSNRYTLDLLPDLSSNNFTLPDNQMIYFRNAFYASNINAFKDYSEYYGNGADYSTKSSTGDFYNGFTYKWVTKRVATNIPTNDDDARSKTITINGGSLSGLAPNILVFVLQKYTNPNNTISTYRSTQNYTIWYNARLEFNPDSMSGAVNYSTDQLDPSVGIAKEQGKVDLYLDGDSTRTWDIYVRIGVPIGNNIAITSIGFS